MIITAYIATGVVFLVLDLLWLGVIAHDFYRKEMATIIAPSFNVAAAFAFYTIYLAGILYFAVMPALADESLPRVMMQGGLFGFFCYATYDLTNLAVIRDYPVKLAIVDIIWGTFLTAASATAGFLAVGFFI